MRCRGESYIMIIYRKIIGEVSEKAMRVKIVSRFCILLCIKMFCDPLCFMLLGLFLSVSHHVRLVYLKTWVSSFELATSLSESSSNELAHVSNRLGSPDMKQTLTLPPSINLVQKSSILYFCQLCWFYAVENCMVLFSEESYAKVSTHSGA